jgi:hypothetical protein
MKNTMKGRKHFKLPQSVLSKAKSLDSQEISSKEPTTAEEFLDQGVEYEESGDRWFTSDLSKAIRFYHRAHNSYKKSLALNPILVDALYNLPRLEFEVYIKYQKDDSVVLDDLDNCADAINDNKKNGIFQDIQSLCESFEASIGVLLQSGNESLIGWDFYFNTAMCYYEYIEILCSEPLTITNLNPGSILIKAIQRCIAMFNNVLDHMKNVLTNNILDDTVNRESVVNICIESYKMISTVYETLYTQELIVNMDSLAGPFVERIDFFANETISDDAAIDLLNSMKIFKLNEVASRQLNYEDFFKIWNSEVDLNSQLQKQLVETSSTRSFIDKFETVDVGLPVELKWKILSNLNNQYRLVTDTLKEEIKNIETSKNALNDLLSGKISLLCSVLIERADIDLERLLLDITEARQNQTILQNNCKNLLKNALIFSKKSGGIRESISGKLTRKKRQREAAMRLCLLEGKSQDEWNIIVGEKYWPIELKTISDIDAYKRFFS